MRRAGRKILSLCLAAALAVGGVTAAPMPVHAAKIQTGKPSLTVNQTVVGFAGKEWYVVGDDSGTNGIAAPSGHYTLLLKSGQGDVDDGYSTTTFGSNHVYDGSTLHTKMREIYSGFNSKEQGLIQSRPVDRVYAEPFPTGSYTTLGNQFVWPLSDNEWTTVSNGLNGQDILKFGDETNFTESDWWLRSPSPIDGSRARVGSADGSYRHIASVSSARGVRPAFLLNLSSVIFTSSTVNGKSDVGVGDDLVGASAPTGNLKFTIQHSSLTLTGVDATALTKAQGESFDVAYDSATGGNYVSCVLAQGTEIKYYGKLEAANSSGGNPSIALPADIPPGSYTLRVFTEEANGNLYTDFASRPVDITLTVTGAMTTAGITLAAPVKGANATDAEPAGGANFTVTSTVWKETDTTNTLTTGDPFQPDTKYTATIKLTADSGHKFADTVQTTDVSISGGGEVKSAETTSGTSSGDTLTVVVDFPATAALAPPVITSVDNYTFTEGVSSSFTVTADNSPTSFAIGGDALPDGVHFADNTGVLSGTPVAGTADTYNLTFTATNGDGTSTEQNFTLTVIASQPGQKTVSVTASPTAGGNPSASPSAATPTQLVTLTANTAEGYSFDRWESDDITIATPTDATTTFNMPDSDVSVTAYYTQDSTPPPGTAPAITTFGLPSGKVGIPYSAPLAATGDTPITWTLESGSLPLGLSLSGNVISGTPTTEGTADFTVKAENSSGEDTADLRIVVDPADSTTPPTPWTPSRPSSSDRSSDSGSTRSWTPPITVPTTYTIDRAEMQKLIAAADKNGWDFARFSSALPATVKAEVWKLLGDKKFVARTTIDKAVQVQLTFPEPAKFTSDMQVSGYVSGSKVDSVRKHFEKWFANPLRAVHLEHSGSFGQPVEVAAKVDLDGMDKDNLYIYRYDKASNSYTLICKPGQNPADYRIDKNGYLHFTTDKGGEYVVSDGALAKK